MWKIDERHVFTIYLNQTDEVKLKQNKEFLFYFDVKGTLKYFSTVLRSFFLSSLVNQVQLISLAGFKTFPFDYLLKIDNLEEEKNIFYFKERRKRRGEKKLGSTFSIYLDKGDMLLLEYLRNMISSHFLTIDNKPKSREYYYRLLLKAILFFPSGIITQEEFQKKYNEFLQWKEQNKNLINKKTVLHFRCSPRIETFINYAQDIFLFERKIQKYLSFVLRVLFFREKFQIFDDDFLGYYFYGFYDEEDDLIEFMRLKNSDSNDDDETTYVQGEKNYTIHLTPEECFLYDKIKENLSKIIDDKEFLKEKVIIRRLLSIFYFYFKFNFKWKGGGDAESQSFLPILDSNDF